MKLFKRNKKVEAAKKLMYVVQYPDNSFDIMTPEQYSAEWAYFSTCPEIVEDVHAYEGEWIVLRRDWDNKNDVWTEVVDDAGISWLPQSFGDSEVLQIEKVK